ncbi:AbgT family transporter [Isoalcanivorax beigongshangi]|uniref:AbgT family transporter n=1 Tax=Isoalcanivorax beigongshangi TaxID=3238810 RepID=A0ABV4AID3_9GAMM
MEQSSRTTRFLRHVERVGNRVPHPALLFVGLCALVLVLSALLAALKVGAAHPLNGEPVAVRSLLSGEGLRYMLAEAVPQFTQFAPVGLALVALLGIGLAERSGLLAHLLGSLVKRAPQGLLVPTVAFAGVLSNLAMDAGYVVLIPLAGVLFQLAGRHPVAGITTAFAAVSGGFSANVLLGPTDVILSGLTTEALRLLHPEATVGVAANYLFMLVSSVLVTVLVTVVTQCWVEPWLGAPPATNNPLEQPQPSTPALIWAVTAMLLMTLAVLALALPAGAPLRGPDGGLLPSPLVDHSVVLISLIAAVGGVVYGRRQGAFRDSRRIIESMEQTWASLAGYLVLMFFAAQFVGWFNWSHIGLVTAIGGARGLETLALSPLSMALAVVVLTALLNLLIGSASAKWAILAPVLVPMLALLGLDAATTQAAYRIGDSTANVITPLMPYFVLILGFMRHYQPQAGVGSLLALMLPYSLVLMLGWSVLLVVWMLAGWPMGW